jgi:2-keto-4-pentenoate hydratase
MEDYNFAKAREAWATPVKIVQYNCTCGRSMKFESEQGVIAPKREWVGLTDEERQAIYAKNKPFIGYMFDAMEAKLKEKNT